MIILGINAYHGDASACILKDGVLLFACEEERLTRIKHWAGFPLRSIESCLRETSIDLKDIDYVAINRNSSANFFRKLSYYFFNMLTFNLIKSRVKNAFKVNSVKSEICKHFKVAPGDLRFKVINVEHHAAHIASSFFVSNFDAAAVVSVDGFGDFSSTAWGVGKGNQFKISKRIYFQHSLGLFYLAITQYLGFKNYGDEYKVMGLAPYGNNEYLTKMRDIIRLLDDGGYELNLNFFKHQSGSVKMLWDEGVPLVGDVYSKELEILLGPERKPSEEISTRHMNIAASAQSLYEEVFFHILNSVQNSTNERNLVLSGGCAMNSVANGKIFSNTKFKNIYIQPAAGDSGGAIGAAFFAYNQKFNLPRSFVMNHAYWGPEYSADDISLILNKKNSALKDANCSIKYIAEEGELCKEIAERISRGFVIGWFQGRMEWGPRALGNRSILGDPRRADMKQILNEKIKMRESFRPFAPSILFDCVADWFEQDNEVPFMQQVFQIKEGVRKVIPAVTHVNGSGRLQTVRKEQNFRYYRLIEEFYKITGVPLILNTSFNENEPIVCSPEEALNCFLRTNMDLIVLGNFVISRCVFVKG